MKGSLYILLPVHNRCDITREFIDCLKAQTFQDYHLVLIDDGSTDGTEQMVREHVNNLTVIKGDGDWWWAGCLQQGFNFLKKKAISPTDSVLIANDDVVFGKDFFAKGISILDKNKHALLLAQFQDGDSSLPKETGIHVDFKKFSSSKPSSPRDINCLSTRGLFLKWGDFLAIGGFHPTILPHYLSDYEFTIRAHKKGYRCLTSPDVTLSPRLHETGRTDIDYSSYLNLLRSLFSIKATANPVYQISFILLVCPLRWIPINLLRIIFRSMLINFSYPFHKLKKVLALLR